MTPWLTLFLGNFTHVAISTFVVVIEANLPTISRYLFGAYMTATSGPICYAVMKFIIRIAWIRIM